jgi:hypothetical protein
MTFLCLGANRGLTKTLSESMLPQFQNPLTPEMEKGKVYEKG